MISWENPVGVQSCVVVDLEGAPAGVAGGVGVGCCNCRAIAGAVGCTGFKRGDCLVSMRGGNARCVVVGDTIGCLFGCFEYFGVVELLESVGSTLGAAATGSSTLGGH